MNDYANKRQASGAYNHAPEAPRNVTDLGTGQLNVTSVPAQISYVSTRRSGIKITNLGGTEIFYGSTVGVNSTSGDLIPAGRGQWVFIPGGSTIFVVCAAGQTGSVSWAEVYD